MEVAVNQNAGRVRVTVKGDIDEKGAEALKKQLSQLDLASLLEVTIDLKEVQYIGSSGIGKILLLYKRLAAKDAKLRVENAGAGIYELFKELRLDTLFTVTAA